MTTQERVIDPRATQRGVTIESPPVSPGDRYWRVVEVRYYAEQESGGRHHIYVEARDDKGNPLTAVPFKVMWPTGISSGQTNGRSGFDAGNFPLSPSRNEFSVKIVSDVMPSEVVKGIGMGAMTPGGYNSGIHTSTGVVFQWVQMPVPQPSPAPVETHLPSVGTGSGPTPTPPPPTRSGIIEPRVAQAILQIESGGQAFGPDGKLLIRFEAHIFKSKLGNDALVDQHFRIGSPIWTGHQFRYAANGAWQEVHTGSQSSEWQAFTLALQLNPDAAYQSTSMGAAQIMGFNAARVGFVNAKAMFDAFKSEQVQVIAFLNYFLSDPGLVDAMRNKDWRTIAAKYNGSGAVDTYAPLLERAYQSLGG